MSTLPPPTGRPVTMFPRPDPWEEQLRRDARHRDERRRRRRAWLFPLVGVSVLAAAALTVLVASRAVDDRSSDPAGAVTESVAPTLDPTIPSTTVAPTELVQVDRVWLMDRGDGVFDWGVSVRTPPGAPTRSGVMIDVRLLDADGALVESASGEVDGIGPESDGAVAGRLIDPIEVPVRIEFDVAVGVASNDRALGDVLDVRALEREPDTVAGRIRTLSRVPIEAVTMVMLWLDDAGEVMAAVPRPVDLVRPDVDARFEVDLGDEVVPDGRPDAVVWTR